MKEDEEMGQQEFLRALYQKAKENNGSASLWWLNAVQVRQLMQGAGVSTGMATSHITGAARKLRNYGVVKMKQVRVRREGSPEFRFRLTRDTFTRLEAAGVMG